MASMSTLSVAVSGLRAAQMGLSVTGHNVSNSSSPGYVRQQAIQQDFSYIDKGNSAIGSLKLQAGLGTNIAHVRQIRNKFYDITYREENSSGNYYARKYTAGDEVNIIIGELNSEYKAQDVLTDLWNNINELSKDPSAIETRTSFIQSCVSLVNKMQNINDSLYNYQMNLNGQVVKEVDSINNLVKQVAELNQKIQDAEADGSRANDLRDARNNVLDELSGYLDIEIKEVACPNGVSTRVDILVEGKELLVDNLPNTIGLKYCNGDYPFVEPVFTSSKEILPASDTSTRLFPNLSTENLGTNSSSTKGSLKGLLVARGDTIGNYTMGQDQVGNYLIPELQRKMDTLMHKIVTLLNDSSTKGLGLDGQAGVPIFIRKNAPQGTQEDPNNYDTLFTLNNIEINPDLLDTRGYNMLGFSATGDVHDNTIILELSKAWKTQDNALEGESIDTYYKKIITDFGIKVQEDREKLEGKSNTIDLAQNQRLALSGVSLDEELSNMLKFQHAYNSAAKIVNVIDSMMDKIINGTGRVGI